MSGPAVSVVMSCYNASKWLAASIDSVRLQTFENFELVLIDDGSTDQTWTIIESYALKDSRILAIRKDNSGLADSLNRGISHSSAPWIARLDADDVAEPARLERQLAYVRQHPDVALLGSAFRRIEESGRIVGTRRYPRRHDSLVRNLERLMRFFPHSSALMRRDITQAAGLYNPRFKKTQDWDLWLRLAERGRLACLAESLVRVRVHSGQISRAAAGPPQIVYGVAAVVCHELRKRGYPDPSQEADPTAWNELLALADRTVNDSLLSKRLSTRDEAHTAYLTADNKLLTTLKLGMRVNTYRLLMESAIDALVGSNLPARVIEEWIAFDRSSARKSMPPMQTDMAAS